MYGMLVTLYALAVILFAITFFQLGSHVGVNEAFKRRRRIIGSFLLVIVLGVILIFMNLWFLLFLPLTFVVLGLITFVVIAIERIRN